MICTKSSTLFISFTWMLLLQTTIQTLIADEVYLKNGLVLNGTAVQVPGINSLTAHRNVKGNVRLDSFWLVDDGVRRYFVHRLLINDIIEKDELAQKVTFTLSHQRTSRKVGPGIVGGFSGIEPFDRFGRRTVMLTTKEGLTPIVQGITELRPDYFKVDGLTHQWEYALDTKTLPPDVLIPLIEQASDRTNPAERKATVTFFLQAGMLTQAQQELERIAQEFPELKSWSDEFRTRIAEAKARSGINEVQRRQQAGQHQLAYFIAKKAPADEVSATVFREAQEIVTTYENAMSQRDTAVLMLDVLQADLKAEQADRIRSMRSMLLDELRFETIDRLKPFLRSQLDDTLSPEQKLALAFSGWVLGDAHATLNLQEAILLWEARFLVLEFLRNAGNDPLRDDELITDLTELEYVTIQRIVQMIPLLPAPMQGPLLQPAEIVVRDVPVSAGDPPSSYSLMLPPEYSPYNEYPLLVVLRAGGSTYDEEIRWWGGDEVHQGWAQRRGYIVIAPHYTSESTNNYAGNTTAHQIVTNAIQDIQKRYRVDSSRIFLAGHGMGADACFDIGMSRFDWFAGVIPITGEVGKICNYYWSNGPDLGWYLVNGERDRQLLDQNANVINNMMRPGLNVVYCDYKSRGYESYFEEQERIFEWMQQQRRPQLADLKEWEVGTMRRSENSFHWVDAKGFREDLFPIDIYSSKRTKTISGKAKLNNTIHVQVPGNGATVWFAPEMIDFNQRVRIHFNSKVAHTDFVQPSIKTLLTRLRQTGDRQRLYWAKVDL